MEAAGFALTPDDAAHEPDAVVVGFDTELTYARLCRTAYWIGQGKPFVATHPDRVCPTDQPTVLVVIDQRTANSPWWQGLDPQRLGGAGMYQVWRLDRQRLEQRAAALRARGETTTWDLPRPERY